MKAVCALLIVVAVLGVKFPEEEAFKQKTISLACLALMRGAISSNPKLVRDISNHPQSGEVTLWFVMQGMETCLDIMDYDFAVELFYKDTFHAKHYDDFYTLDVSSLETRQDWALTTKQQALLDKLKALT